MNLLNSFLLDCCPLDASLTAIDPTTCPENLGQIQRYWFVRAGQVKWDIATPADNLPASILGLAPEDITGWNTLFAAPDDTKVIKTPLIGGDATLTAGTNITQGGGDNSTLNGEQLINGINPTDGMARFDSLTGAQIAAFRKLICEASGLEVYLVNQEGKIWGSKVGDIFTGFPCTNAVLGGLTNNGFGTRDFNNLTYQLPFDADESKHAITPTFQALTV